MDDTVDDTVENTVEVSTLGHSIMMKTVVPTFPFFNSTQSAKE